MARGFVEITNSGLTEIADYLDKLADDYNEVLYQSVEAMQDVVVDRIKANWVAMVGGDAGGFVYNSIGKSTIYSREKEFSIAGTMGVYKLDTISASFGKTDKDFNAAQIAYWVEYGTSRLKSGARKPRKGEISDEDLISVAAKPFISNAYNTTINEQNDAFSIKFNELMDRVK